MKILYDPLRVYKVRGVFEAGMQTDKTYGVSLFRLRHAQVEEAVGAKIFKVRETVAPASNQYGRYPCRCYLRVGNPPRTHQCSSLNSTGISTHTATGTPPWRAVPSLLWRSPLLE